ncbi:MAG TPA: DegV family protein [Patescibacteria group bacterium]|nr:DegV family protein [Patescibacteria group bacterium]
MTQTIIVADSTAGITPAMLADNANLRVVPLQVIIGGAQWAEDTITADDMFRLCREQGAHPRTSQPAPGAFMEAFAPARDGVAVIMITVSGGLSGTVEGARAVARQMASENLFVVDSATAAIGTRKLVEDALRLTAGGMPAATVAAQLEQMARGTHTLIVPATLEYLHKGGRIGGAAALFGAILQVRPVLHLVDGSIKVLDKVRTQNRALVRAVEEVASCSDPDYIAVAHVEARETAETVREQLRQRYPDRDISLTEASPVLGAHLGPGVVGIFFRERLV